jgi:hypothetical protein
MPIAHEYSALAWGIGLFVFSFGLSAYGLYSVNRKKQGLEIHSAHWGPTATRFENITKDIRSRIVGNSLDVLVDYRDLGDPLRFRGEGKKLTVEYSLSGVASKPERPDPVRLVIPEPRPEELRLHNELNGLRSEVAKASKRIAELEQETARAQPLNTARNDSEFWPLKYHLREIRRRWPDSPFILRPLYRKSWLPTAGDNAPWFISAEKWHSMAMHVQFLANAGESVLNSLDFDDVMEWLDDADRMITAGFPYRLHLPAGFPNVIAVRWGQSPVDGHWGIFVKNVGGTALNVRMHDVRFNTCVITCSTVIKLLTADHGECFLPLNVVDNNMNKELTQFPSDAELSQRVNHFPLGTPMRLTYDDTLGDPFISLHEIDVTYGADELSIRHINVELLSMLQQPSASQ